MAQARAGTEIEAANGALDHLGQPPIGDFADGNTRARVMQRAFGSVRDRLLREHYWNFAKAWLKPAAGTAPTHGTFTKRYPLPESTIAVRFVETLTTDEWSVEKAPDGEVKALLTDATAPVVCITERITNPLLWDALFLDAFQLRLAARGAGPILKSRAEAERLDQRASDIVKEARLFDGKEDAPSAITRETSWVTARRIRGRR